MYSVPVSPSVENVKKKNFSGASFVQRTELFQSLLRKKTGDVKVKESKAQEGRERTDLEDLAGDSFEVLRV